ncbi:MAG: hypothetical protein COA44_10690 [Arcobacter sp.]|nr:MAG: hypothetical protein COA44_10690 [Arcobacter sp.]
MMLYMTKRLGFKSILIWFIFVFFLGDAFALSQWSRKYGVSCTRCHTSFPRLSSFGEKFMRNGYQWPRGEPDGGTTGKDEISDNLSIDQVGNWLGARISLTPIDYKTNSIIENGKPEDSFDIGNSNWLQLFIAGSIYKDVSIFIEQEFEEDGAKFNWYHLTFTNLSDSYVNFQIGNLSPVDFSPFSDRLRIWQKSDVLNLKSSGGKGENSINIRSPRSGIQYYGYKGPAMLYAGVDNGKDSSDTDRQKNYWIGFKLEVPETAKGGMGSFKGSSFGYHFYTGTDTNNSEVDKVTNDFRRHTASANIRYESSLDIQFVYQYGVDDNYDLANTAVKKNFTGFTFVGAYLTDPWFFVLQYDQIDSSDIPSLELQKLSPSIWFFPRENFKAGIAGRIDINPDGPEEHELTLQLRAMF